MTQRVPVAAQREASQIANEGLRLLQLDEIWSTQKQEEVHYIDYEDDRDRQASLIGLGEAMIEVLRSIAGKRDFLTREYPLLASDAVSRNIDRLDIGEREFWDRMKDAVEYIAEHKGEEIDRIQQQMQELGRGGMTAGDLTPRMRGAVTVLVGALLLAGSLVTGVAPPVSAALLTLGATMIAVGWPDLVR
ncbi:hypothetical protein [Streptomyces sp. NPDC017993]|uniref:hypothetical protein n=1 Tax=Streptomyces sp. NPDC017993 TaxID=3365027 RepID=UPI0037A473A4